MPQMHTLRTVYGGEHVQAYVTSSFIGVECVNNKVKFTTKNMPVSFSIVSNLHILFMGTIQYGICETEKKNIPACASPQSDHGIRYSLYTYLFKAIRTVKALIRCIYAQAGPELRWPHNYAIFYFFPMRGLICYIFNQLQV